MDKKKKLIVAILVIVVICAIYLLWLMGTKGNDVPATTTGVQSSSAATDATPSTTPAVDGVIVEANRVTITSLDRWNEFNTALAPCHEFTTSLDLLKAIILGQSSEFDEFQGVKLGKWEIVRDHSKYKSNEFEFNFTVTASTLDTLEVGSYKTVIRESHICTIKFIGNDPRVPKEEVTSLSSGAEAVCQWIDSTRSRTMPEYGAEEINEISKLKKCVDYILDRYNSGENMQSYELKKAIKDKFGTDVSNDSFDKLDAVVTDGKLYVTKQSKFGNNYAQYSIIGDKTDADEKTTVTVQFFADSSRFIKTDVVEFYLDAEERILGCERIFIGKYPPFEIYNVFTDFS